MADEGLDLVAETLFAQTGNVFFQKYKVLATPNDTVWLWFHPNGRMCQRIVKRCNEPYCETGPAVQRWYQRNGGVKLAAWSPIKTAPLPPGAPHRVEYHPNGVLKSKDVRVYDDHGDLIGIKCTGWYDNGQKRSRKHFRLHDDHEDDLWLSRRGGKPAHCQWFRSGGIKSRFYYVDGTAVRDTGEPYVIEYYASGRVKRTQELVGRRMIHHAYYASGAVERVICAFKDEHDKGYALHNAIYARDGTVKHDMLTVQGARVEPDKVAKTVRELVESESGALSQTPTCPTS